MANLHAEISARAAAERADELPGSAPSIERASSVNAQTVDARPVGASDGDGAYVQMGWGDPGSNGWGADWTPTTQFGDESWAVSGIEFRRAQCGRT